MPWGQESGSDMYSAFEIAVESHLDIGNEVEIRHDDNDTRICISYPTVTAVHVPGSWYNFCNDHQPTGYCGQLDSGYPVMLSGTQENTDRGNCQFGIACPICFKDSSAFQCCDMLQSNLEQER